MDENTLALKKIRDDLLHDSSLPLYAYRIESHYFPVIGEGNHYADIVCIGEAPGKQEALSGKPFCGKSGKVLDSLFEQSGMSRSDVYITNIVKDRPPENRDPTPHEIQAYSRFLDQQLSIIKPKVIVTLGRFSMDYILRKYGCIEESVSIGAVHGKIFNTQTEHGALIIIPLYHPAVAVYNPHMFKELLKDFQQVKKLV